MPIPLILGLAVFNTIGMANMIKNTVITNQANNDLELAKSIHQKSVDKIEKAQKQVQDSINNLDTVQRDIYESFIQFALLIEKIQSKPDFKKIRKSKIDLPEIELEDIKSISVAVQTLPLCTPLMATSVIGGFPIFGLVVMVAQGVKLAQLSNQANEAMKQANEEAKKADESCELLYQISKAADSYCISIKRVNDVYKTHLNMLDFMINKQNKIDWDDFDANEKLVIENLSLLVTFLYKMCKVELLIKDNQENEKIRVNENEIIKITSESEEILKMVS
ncbi:MAG: hypothetical protein PUI48_06775 [Oscillospiraceae bacterium]|nr:hypothetical protein [Oscillospiraceae bacterium]MDY6207912.1 hypothetical protein [Oscillospiraceae bacterium]